MKNLMFITFLTLSFSGTVLAQSSKKQKPRSSKKSEYVPPIRVLPYDVAQKKCRKELGKKASAERVRRCIRKKQGIKFPNS